MSGHFGEGEIEVTISLSEPYLYVLSGGDDYRPLDWKRLNDILYERITQAVRRICTDDADLLIIHNAAEAEGTKVYVEASFNACYELKTTERGLEREVFDEIAKLPETIFDQYPELYERKT